MKEKANRRSKGIRYCTTSVRNLVSYPTKNISMKKKMRGRIKIMRSKA